MVVIRTIDHKGFYVAASAEQAKSETDRSGIEEALKVEDAVTIGRTVYEYSSALGHFAKTQGERWRTALRQAWCEQVYPENTPKVDIPALQRLQSTLGGKL